MIKCTFENGKETSLRHAVVDSLVIKDNQILLVKRAQNLVEGGKWAIPGGFVERGDTVEKTVLKEILEETGYQGKIIKFIGFRDNPNREDRQNISFVYLVQPLEKISEPDEETDEARWFDLDKLPPQNEIAFDHFEIIKEYKDSKI